MVVLLHRRGRSVQRGTGVNICCMWVSPGNMTQLTRVKCLRHYMQQTEQPGGALQKETAMHMMLQHELDASMTSWNGTPLIMSHDQSSTCRQCVNLAGALSSSTSCKYGCFARLGAYVQTPSDCQAPGHTQQVRATLPAMTSTAAAQVAATAAAAGAATAQQLHLHCPCTCVLMHLHMQTGIHRDMHMHMHVHVCTGAARFAVKENVVTASLLLAASQHT